MFQRFNSIQFDSELNKKMKFNLIQLGIKKISIPAYLLATYILVNKNDVNVVTFDKSLKSIFYFTHCCIYKNLFHINLQCAFLYST